MYLTYKIKQILLGPSTERPYFLIPREEHYEEIERISKIYEDELYSAFEKLKILEIDNKQVAVTYKLAPQFDTKLIKMESGLTGAYCTGMLNIF